MARRKKVLVVSYPGLGEDTEVWGSLSKLCEAKDWSYWTMSRLDFPISHASGAFIERIEIKGTNRNF